MIESDGLVAKEVVSSSEALYSCIPISALRVVCSSKRLILEHTVGHSTNTVSPSHSRLPVVRSSWILPRSSAPLASGTSITSRGPRDFRTAGCDGKASEVLVNDSILLVMKERRPQTETWYSHLKA